MGLCKCPKRRVTNQFCFEHRVCVCENCMVTNHPICVVQSYLQWLQDSDYNSICELCNKELHIDDSIRLTCYHVFHWSCLDHFCRQLPPTTAPRGYTCPSCKNPLFPPANLVSPVADVLKEKLAGVNWARAGLGLPLLAEEREVKKSNKVSQRSSLPTTNHNGPHSVLVDVGGSSTVDGTFNRTIATSSNSTTVLNDLGSNINRGKGVYQGINKNVDHDDDKYKRRPISELITTWWKITFGTTALRTTRSRRSIVRRYCLFGTFILLAAFLFFFAMSRLSRSSLIGGSSNEEDRKSVV